MVGQPQVSSSRDGLTAQIIGAAIDVHRCIGPGLLESAYQTCLAWELRSQGIAVARHVFLPLAYKDVTLDVGYRIDLMIDRRVIVEVKSVAKLLPVHEAQLLTYLKLSGIRKGCSSTLMLRY
jgi:GxxExxY protein